MLSRIPGSGTPPEDGNGTDRASKPRLLKAFSSNRPGHDEMLPTDYTSATGYAASGKRHHLWKPGGHATTAASTDSLVAQGPQRGCDSCRTVQNRCFGREIWYAASRGLLACGLSTQRELYKGEKAPAASRPSASRSTCRVFSSKLSKASWLSLSCRSRLKKSISAPRSREPQKASLCNASLLLSTDQRKVP
jgi:hypothetical protein